MTTLVRATTAILMAELIADPAQVLQRHENAEQNSKQDKASTYKANQSVQQKMFNTQPKHVVSHKASVHHVKQPAGRMGR